MRILFVELLGGIGDVLIALSAIQALTRSYPQAHLTVLTLAPGSQLLQHDPLIHRVIEADSDHPRQSLEAVLADQAFDLIVSDTNYDGIGQLIQQSGAAKTVTNLWQSPPSDERVGDRFVQILLAEGIIQPTAIAPPQLHLTPSERQQAQAKLSHLPHPRVVLYPDAGMEIKRWPLSHFVALGRAMQTQYGATIIVPVGSDPQQTTDLAEQLGEMVQILPRSSLRELTSAIACTDLLVAADTGIARIAAALNVPTITLFGPSWHGRYGQPEPHINLQGYPDCPERVTANFTEQRCWYGGDCPLDRWHTCLEDISPDQVLAAAASFLGDRNPKRDQIYVSISENRKLPESRSPVFITSSTEHSSPSKSHQDWANVRNLLVMRLDNIGDVIMTSPVLRSLRENLPHAHITLMASPGGSYAAPLLPWVDEVLTWRTLWQDLGKLSFDPAREWELIETLGDRHFDAAIILTSFSQSPHPPALICHLAGIPLRLGASKETGNGLLHPEIASPPDEIHQVERNLQLIEAVGLKVKDRSLQIQIPPAERDRAILHLQQRGLDADAPYILLNPWTSCQARNYDSERFAIAARELAHLTGWPVLVTGVEKDRDRSAALLDILGSHAIDLIGATTLLELAALIDTAQLVLTNNTSTMHIADATRTPSVVLFAGTEYESQWQPRHGPFRLLRQPTACSPCYAFTCPYDLECLDISPNAVVEAARSLLQHSAQIPITSEDLKGSTKIQISKSSAV